MNAWSPLRGRGAFHQIRRDGKKIQCEFVQCWYQVKPSTHPQVTAGFAIKRGAFSAVRRNKLRRRMKEAFRLELDGPGNTIREQNRHTSVLFFLKAGNDPMVARVSYGNLQKDIATLCRSIALKL